MTESESILVSIIGNLLSDMQTLVTVLVYDKNDRTKKTEKAKMITSSNPTAQQDVRLTGNDITKARKKLGISVRTLATEVGIPHNTIASYESNPRKNNPVSSKNVMAIANALTMLAKTKGVTL